MRLACVQLGVEGGAIEDNVAAAMEAVRESAADGADLVVLPELFDVGFAFDAYARAAESVAGDRLSRPAVADEEDINVLAGTVVEDLSPRPRPTGSRPRPTRGSRTLQLFDRAGSVGSSTGSGTCSATVPRRRTGWSPANGYPPRISRACGSV